MMFRYRQNETHVTMLRDCRIRLQKDAAHTYVVTDGSKLRN